MTQWINFYNNERLHGALLYLTPEDYFAGRKENRLADRREKLHNADIKRKAYWLEQQSYTILLGFTKKSKFTLSRIKTPSLDG